MLVSSQVVGPNKRFLLNCEAKNETPEMFPGDGEGMRVEEKQMKEALVSSYQKIVNRDSKYSDPKEKGKPKHLFVPSPSHL